MPYTTNWVMTDGSDPEIEASSFVHSFAWVSSTLDASDTPTSDSKGRMLVCLNPNGSVDRYVYPRVEYRKFERLRDAARSGDSVGSAYNDLLKHNHEVEDAVSLNDFRDSDKDAAAITV